MRRFGLPISDLSEQVQWHGHVLLQAVGETWDKFPELKFLALKRMYKYMVCSCALLFP